MKEYAVDDNPESSLVRRRPGRLSLRRARARGGYAGGSRTVGEGLRHECCSHTALFGKDGDQVAQGDYSVGGCHRIRVIEILFELSGSVLVVVGGVPHPRRSWQ